MTALAKATEALMAPYLPLFPIINSNVCQATTGQQLQLTDVVVEIKMQACKPVWKTDMYIIAD